QGPAEGDPRPAAVAAAATSGMPVPPALFVRHGHLPADAAAARCGGWERLAAPVGLLSGRCCEGNGGWTAGGQDPGGQMSANGSSDDLLVVEDLEKHFPVTRGIVFQREIGRVRAVDGVSLHVA